MKKHLSILLAIMVGISMLVPTASLAEESGSKVAKPAGYTPVTESYVAQEMTALKEAGKLSLPSSMDGVSLDKSRSGDGLLVQGKISALTAGRIQVKQEFNFDKPVGRLSIDGLADRGMTVRVQVYLDDESSPLGVFTLKRQMGKKDWATAGDLTKDISEQKLSGKHRISLAFEIEGKAPSKNTTFLLRSVEFAQSSLPTMIFNIDESQGSIAAMNGDSSHSTECYGSVDLQVPEGYKSEYGGAQTTQQNLKLEYIRGRGNSTWMADKKPYKVKFDKKQDLFGMGANKHWVLLANRYDNSLVRNRLTYWLGAKLGMEFTPQCVPVDVVMNGEYYGSYLLCEQIRVGDSRVNIDDLESKQDKDATTEPIVTGGYLLSMSPYGEEDPNLVFSTKKDAEFFIEHPSYEESYNQAQINYIKKYVQDTEDAIFGTDFKNAAGKSYRDYLDVNAAVDYWWIQEFSANGDAYGSGSTYLYKKRSGKLFWGPLWDFDYVAWGDLDYEGSAPEGFDNTDMPWFQQLKRDQEFGKKLTERWKVLNGLLEQATKKGGQLDSYRKETEVSWYYDREKWGAYEETGFWAPVAGTSEETKIRTYGEELDQLRGWIEGRRAWANENINSLIPTAFKVTFKAKGKVVKTVSRLSGDELGTLPKAPKKKGYVFAGWYTKDGERYRKSDPVFESMTLIAKYVKKKKAVKAKKLYFNDYDVYLQVEYDEQLAGESEVLQYYAPGYTVMPKNSIDDSVTWSSSNTSIATVDEGGEVSCLKPGVVTITGKLVTGVKASYKLHILSVDEVFNSIETFKLNKKKVKLKKGKYTQVRAITGPKPCPGAECVWISVNPKIADVDNNGVITAKKPGKTRIIAYESELGLRRQCTVIVTGKKATLKGKAIGKKKVKLTWKKKKGAKGYKIYRATKKKGKYRKIATVKGKKKTRYIVKRLKKGKTYYFKVRSYTKKKGKTKHGRWSNIVKVKVR